MKTHVDTVPTALSSCTAILDDVIKHVAYTILVVDDQEETRLSTRLLLESEGYHVRTATNGAEALAQFDPEHVDLVILDYLMPRMSGARLIQEVRKRDANIPILLQTGYSGEETPHDLLHVLNVQGYHNKIDGPDRLLLWIKTICRSAELTRRLAHERLSMMKLYTTLHEMRTRLHFILAHSHFLLDDVQSRPFVLIQKSVAALLHHHATLEAQSTCARSPITDQASSVTYTPLPVRLVDYEHDIRCLAQSLILNTSVQFVCDINTQLPPLRVDLGKLFVIIHNLLEHTARTTSHGELRLSTDYSLTHNRFTLTIQATAMANTTEADTVIATCQHSAASPFPWEYSKTTTGLVVAYLLTVRLGGTLTVSSTPETGTTFSVVLPLDDHMTDAGAASQG